MSHPEVRCSAAEVLTALIAASVVGKRSTAASAGPRIGPALSDRRHPRTVWWPREATDQVGPVPVGSGRLILEELFDKLVQMDHLKHNNWFFFYSNPTRGRLFSSVQ